MFRGHRKPLETLKQRIDMFVFLETYSGCSVGKILRESKMDTSKAVRRLSRCTGGASGRDEERPGEAKRCEAYFEE